MSAGVAQSRVILLGTEVTYDAFGVPTYGVTGVMVGTSIPWDCRSNGIISIYLRSIGTTTGGTVIIEEADWSDFEAPYSGTWVQLASVSASAFTGGAQSVYRPTVDSAFGFIRVRISATITGGGTITAVARSRGAM